MADDDEFEDDTEDDEEPAIYLTDRTTAETDDKCGMRRWWYKHEGGWGIVPVKESIHLTVGKETHEDLATVAGMEDISFAAIDDAVRELIRSIPGDTTDAQRELLYRRLGWLAAYALYIEPKVRETFETVSVEAEHILDRDPLWISYTPDRYLRHRQGRYLVYKEYKTTISAGPKWMTSWAFKPQVHIGLAGMQEELKERVAYAQVMGLLKGDYSWGNEPRMNHPYVWGWYHAGKKEWTHDYQKARTAGWEKLPIWEYEGGPAAWVQRCGPDIAISQFPHTPPIFYNPRLLDDWVLRRTIREAQVAEVVEECRVDLRKRVIWFEPRTDQCRPPFGDACPYQLACHNAAINENPLGCRDYQRRTPHHETEVRYLAGDYE